MVNQTTANQLKFISFPKQKVSKLLLVTALFDSPLTQNARGKKIDGWMINMLGCCSYRG